MSSPVFKKTENSLEVRGLTVAYSGEVALWNVSLAVPRGVLMAVVGPNGAGKTTLVKAVQNLVPAVAGRVSVFGGAYEDNRKSVAYVPQRESVDWNFPANVADVVQMGTYASLGWIRRPGGKEKLITADALKKTGMEDCRDRQIGEISGGQRQRVFIARALAQNADLYLMDEPFQGVDKTTEAAIAKLLGEMKEEGKTMVIVHHDLQTVPDYFDWVTLLNKKVVASGPLEEVFTRENVRRAYGSDKAAVLRRAF